ncbi:sulfatase-like hydrolase/transferase [Thermococcus sp. 21S9]|uniref:sulfatase-like hydrolase/transferase n=2 Tax=unclassified Thermococcus TaxID=2627626 RepID=UPI001439F368|nr:sulfatase-like hydrolase/transferase [Thermococcus sp. 21S9]
MKKRPNIFIIVLDTLRKDYSENIERTLEKMGFVNYTHAIAPSPWTIPSHASMLTGLYPSFHRAHETRTKKIPHVKLVQGDSLLTFKLRRAGYTTALLTANFFVHPEFGFKGFDYVYYSPPMTVPSILSQSERKVISDLFSVYQDIHSVAMYLFSRRKYKLLLKSALQYSLNRSYPYIMALIKHWPIEKGITSITKNLDSYLDRLGHSKYYNNFVFINTIEMHEPYLVNDNLSVLSEHLKTGNLDQGFATKWRIRYDTQAKYLVHKLSSLLHVLESHDIFDNSLIVVTSDHGQLLGEHGRIGHGNFLYDELLRVPLLIKYPSFMDVHTSNCIDDEWKWISLNSLKSLTVNIAMNKKGVSDEVLFSDVVFSESYGIAGKVIPNNTTELKNIMHLEKYRIAVYYRTFKGIFNVTNWKFEDIISYDPSISITPNIVSEMKKAVVQFLKRQLLVKRLRKLG